MITTTEDNFDVDYDIFSFTGRAALIGGGIYALNKSFQEGHFKDLKGNRNALKRNNSQVQNYKTALERDLLDRPERVQADYSFRETTEFLPTKEMTQARKSKSRLVSGLESEIVIGTEKKTVKSLFTGGYNGNSKGLPSALATLQETIMAHDGRTSAPMMLHFNDNDDLASISIRSNAGNILIPIVDKESYITQGVHGQNKVLTRSGFTREAGYAPGKPFGMDLAMAEYINQNYEKLASGEMTLKEIKHTASKFTRHADKNFGQMVSNKINPATVEEMRQSSILNPFEYFSPSQKEKIMSSGLEKGYAIGNASSLNDGILYLEGDPYKNDPFNKETENPRQKNRSHTRYKRKNGKEVYNEMVDVMHMDDNAMEILKEELAKDGIRFGELGKEERLVNSSVMGTVIDSSRAISISNTKMSAASDFIFERLAGVAGISKDEFIGKIREGKGFSVFEADVVKRLQQVGIDDYTTYLEEMKREALSNRKAMLLANNDTLLNERKDLLKQKDAISRVIKGRKPVTTQDYEMYKIFKQNGAGDLSTRLGTINKRLGQIRKQAPASLIRSDAYKQAQQLKQKGLLNQGLVDSNNSINSINEQIKNSGVFGVSKDGRDIVKLGRKERGLLIDEIKVTDNEINFAMRRESKMAVGTKFHDPSGENKATAKMVVDNLGKYIDRTYERITGKKVTEEISTKNKNVALIGTNKSLKTEPEMRTLNSLYLSIREKVRKGEADPRVTSLINDFEGKYTSLPDQEKINLWHKLRDLGIDFKDMAGNTTPVGYVKTSQIAFSADNIDMGFGGDGFFSERHFRLYDSMGIPGYTQDIMARRVNKGGVKLYHDFKVVQQMMRDSAKAGFINMENLNAGDFFDNVFNSSLDEKSSAFDLRKTYLKSFAQEKGVAFINLGEEIEGIKNLPIFLDNKYKGFAGEQIGSSSDYRRYTELEDLTKSILRESRKGADKDTNKLKTLIKNYKTAIMQMDKDLEKGSVKGKFKNSGYLQFKSGSEELKDYATRLAKANGTEKAIPLVASVSKKRFVKMFGKDAFDTFMKTGISDNWGVVLREPTDAASALPFNFIPSSATRNLRHLSDDVISVMEEVLPMIGGDLDADASSVGAALESNSKKQVRELAFGNSANSLEFRDKMIKKTQISLKGRGVKSIFEYSLEDQRKASFLGKILEKGLVGHVSNSLGAIQQVNQRLNGLSNPNKFHNTTLLVGLLVENTIKGKKQSMGELLDKKSQRMLDSIVGKDDFALKSIDERMGVVRGFLDELILDEGAIFGDRIRKGENSKDFIKEVATLLGKDAINQSHYDAAEKMVNNTILKELTSDDALRPLFEYSDMAKDYKTIGQDAHSLVFEKTSGKPQSEIRLLAAAEETQEAIKNTKKTMSGIGKNLGKYALLPAAGLGLMGTVFGARSSVNSDIEFSDNEQVHNKSLSKSQMYSSPINRSQNMKQPVHMKPEIRGQANQGFQINKYAGTHRTNSVHIQDDTRNFDYYDMQDTLRKGF